MREVNPVVQAQINSINTRIAKLESKAKALRTKVIKVYEEVERVRAELYDISVDDLYISIYTLNALKENKVMTVGQLMELGEYELLGLPRIGKTSINGIRGELEALGLDLPYMTRQIALDHEVLADNLPFFLKSQAE
jgi:DNA-directed RNA polymerase alpha subunit